MKGIKRHFDTSMLESGGGGSAQSCFQSQLLGELKQRVQFIDIIYIINKTKHAKCILNFPQKLSLPYYILKLIYVYINLINN